MLIFKWIESHYNAMIADNQISPLRIIIMETVGIRKSYLINAIRDRLNEIAKDNRINKSPVLVLALTGVAAFNIHRTTIHSAFSIPVNSKNFEIDNKRLKQLQKKLQDIEYFIIDEKSMIRCQIFALIDMRLWQAFPE